MKNARYIAAFLLLSLSLSLQSVAQEKDRGDGPDFFKFGLKAGITFNSASNFEVGYISESVSSHTGFVAGAAFSFDLPVSGLTIQPELNYISKGARFANKGDVRIDFIELPVNLQWGLDLILLRPFLMVSPYVGYALYRSPSERVPWSGVNRFEYGIGIGGGVDFWRLQLQVKYCWNFSPVVHKQAADLSSDRSVMGDVTKSGNFRGLEVSLAFFF